MAEPPVTVSQVVTSKLSAKAPEFYPSGYNQNISQNFTVSVFLLSICQFTYIQINNVFLRSCISDSLNAAFAEEIQKMLISSPESQPECEVIIGEYRGVCENF